MQRLFYNIYLNLYISDQDFFENRNELRDQGMMDAYGLGINADISDEFLESLGTVLSLVINGVLKGEN